LLSSQGTFVVSFEFLSLARGEDRQVLIEFNPMEEHFETREICIGLPPPVNSDGIWSNVTLPLTNFSLPLLETQMIAIFSTTQISHLILKSFGLPKFVSEMIVCPLLNLYVLWFMIHTYLFAWPPCK
jgi:hypothetical protein